MLSFSLTVNDGSLSSVASTVDVTVNPPVVIVGGADITASASIIAFITAPTGGGSRNLEVIRDGVTPAVGSTNYALQYDTYNGGGARPEDWIGYSYTTNYSFNKLVFQEGGNFSDGGAFTTLQVQVRQGTTWVNVPNVTVVPAYSGANGVSFETFTFGFPGIVGNGIRIDGAPAGSAHFISVGELRVFGDVVTGANSAPTANAGAAQTVASAALVTLDGSASSDPEGSALTYIWTQTAGPAVALSSTTAQKPTFTAPTVGAATALTFSLVVSDGSLSSAAATVTITVNPPVVVNTPPTARAGAAQSVASAALVTLDGSASSDPEGSALTYIWTQTAGPAVALSSTTDQNPTYTAPTVAVTTTLSFSLVVSDGSLSSAAATVTITANPPVVVNMPPTARAGAAQSVASAALVILDGSASSDPEGSALTYIWTQTAGPAVALSSTTAQKPTFTAPTVGAATALTFSLVVSDGSLSSAATTVTITVNAQVVVNTAPTANAGVAQLVASAAPVTLDGSASSDPEGSALTYIWTQTAGPAVTLSSTTAQKPTFIAPTVAATTTLSFSLVVSDGSLSSAAATVTITVNAQVVVNTAPTANAGVAQLVASAAPPSLSTAARRAIRRSSALHLHLDADRRPRRRTVQHHRAEADLHRADRRRDNHALV